MRCLFFLSNPLSLPFKRAKALSSERLAPLRLRTSTTLLHTPRAICHPFFYSCHFQAFSAAFDMQMWVLSYSPAAFFQPPNPLPSSSHYLPSWRPPWATAQSRTSDPQVVSEDLSVERMWDTTRKRFISKHEAQVGVPTNYWKYFPLTLNGRLQRRCVQSPCHLYQPIWDCVFFSPQRNSVV